MNLRFNSPLLRGCALILAAVCLAAGFLAGINTMNCVSWGFLAGEPVYQTTWRCAELVRSQGYAVIEQFRRNPDFKYWYKMLEDTNLRFIILEETSGDVVAYYLDGLNIDPPENLKNNIFLYQYDHVMSKGEYGTVLEDLYVCDYYFGEDWSGDTSYWQQEQQIYEENLMVQKQEHLLDEIIDAAAEPVEEAPVVTEAPAEPETYTGSYQILYLLDEHIDPYCGDSVGNCYRMYLYYKSQVETAPSQLGVCVLAFLALVVYLLVTAGRKSDTEERRLTWFDRIPTDLMLAAGFLAFMGFVWMVILVMDTSSNAWLTLDELEMLQVLTSAGATACGTVLLLILCSFSARIKAGTFWKSALTFRAVVWCWNTGKRAVLWSWKQAVLGVRSVGMVPRAVLTLLGVFFVEFLLLGWLVNTWNPVFPIIALILFNLVLVMALIWGFAQMRILQKAAKALANGELDNHLDTSRMYWEFRQHGDNLNAIAGGMNKAVEQRMKSERLKTELITNVSHDIKTPLTSIVNYVDLLQKPHTEAEGIQYLEVLDRQSKRLKKLTENLVEASKASTGNLPVDLQPTSVLELLNQAVEEYRDRLEAGHLEIVMDLRGDLTVLADGKHMWRILDNLLNNVIKYAMPGTRVYVTAQKRGDRVVIAVKNISRDPLNVDAEELMERFVRGDSSRTTEGTGLGLNIARSLTVLQNGSFEVTVDGDLFKAEIALPCV